MANTKLQRITHLSPMSLMRLKMLLTKKQQSRMNYLISNMSINCAMKVALYNPKMKLVHRLKAPLLSTTTLSGRGPKMALQKAKSQQVRMRKWSEISRRQEMSEVTFE